MNDPDSTNITQYLNGAAAGDPDASLRLLPLVYEELRRVARQRMARTPPGNTLTPTALVHEAYVKLVEHRRLPWESSRHFFLAASRAMRNILVDQARRKAAVKHGAGLRRVDIADVDPEIDAPAEDVVALDEALRRLEQEEPEIGEVVELHHFVGLSLEETARILQVSESTAKRRWRYARAWLHRALRESDPT